MLTLNRISPLLSVLLLLPACGGSSTATDPGGGGGGVPPSAEVTQLRAELASGGFATTPDAQPISDELFALGQALFFDKLLSGNMDVSCSTCHLPSFAGGDGRTLPSGVHGLNTGPARSAGDIVPRHSPMILNAHLLETAFWDSRVEPLGGGTIRVPGGATLSPAMLAAFTPGLEIAAAQAMFPPTSRGEMRGQLGENDVANLADADFDGIWTTLTARVTGFPAYQVMLDDAYPGVLLADINFAHLANAIAAFEHRGFARFDSPFERFVAGDDAALTTAQLDGALEFFGPGRCDRCHSGPTFTDNDHHNIGMPQFGPGAGDGVSTLDDFGREQVTGNVNDRYRYRTPTLLNVELTGPYGMLGQYADLQDFVQHYRNPSLSLNAWSLAANVPDPALAGTQLANQADVLARLAPQLNGPQGGFNAGAIVEFLRSLTADSARDLSDLVPPTVPSGLPIDG